jgi:hypothetical protein
MSQRVRKNTEYLRLLTYTHRAQQIALVKSISSEQLKTICEIALNILEGIIPLKPSQKSVLSRYKNFIRLIGQKKGSQSSKKASLLKNIKALAVLLKSALPLFKS